MPASFSIAQNFVLLFLTFSATGIAFAWGAWHLGRRWGVPGLVVSWAVGALATTALMVVRFHQQQTALGISTEQQAQFPAFPMLLPMWLTAFGAVVLMLRIRIRRGEKIFSAGSRAMRYCPD